MVTKLEKMAQNKSFGPFNLNHCLELFKNGLTHDFVTINSQAVGIISTGAFEYRYTFNKKLVNSATDLQDIRQRLQLHLIALRQPYQTETFTAQSLKQSLPEMDTIIAG